MALGIFIYMGAMTKRLRAPLRYVLGTSGALHLLRRVGNAAGDAVEVCEHGFVGGFSDEVADQVDRAELGIGHVEAGRVR